LPANSIRRERCGNAPQRRRRGRWKVENQKQVSPFPTAPRYMENTEKPRRAASPCARQRLPKTTKGDFSGNLNVSVFRLIPYWNRPAVSGLTPYWNRFSISGLICGLEYAPQKTRPPVAIEARNVVHVVRLRLEGLLVNLGKALNPAVSRRTVIPAGWPGFLAGSPLLRSQQDPFTITAAFPALSEMLDAFDFEPVACAKVTRQAGTTCPGASTGSGTMRRNRRRFDWVRTGPRGIAGAAPVQTASTFLGLQLKFRYSSRHGPPRAVTIPMPRRHHAAPRRIQHAVDREAITPAFQWKKSRWQPRPLVVQLYPQPRTRLQPPER